MPSDILVREAESKKKKMKSKGGGHGHVQDGARGGGWEGHWGERTDRAAYDSDPISEST